MRACGNFKQEAVWRNIKAQSVDEETINTADSCVPDPLILQDDLYLYSSLLLIIAGVCSARGVSPSRFLLLFPEGTETGDVSLQLFCVRISNLNPYTPVNPPGISQLLLARLCVGAAIFPAQPETGSAAGEYGSCSSVMREFHNSQPNYF